MLSLYAYSSWKAIAIVVSFPQKGHMAHNVWASLRISKFLQSSCVCSEQSFPLRDGSFLATWWLVQGGGQEPSLPYLISASQEGPEAEQIVLSAACPVGCLQSPVPCFFLGLLAALAAAAPSHCLSKECALALSRTDLCSFGIASFSEEALEMTAAPASGGHLPSPILSLSLHGGRLRIWVDEKRRRERSGVGHPRRLKQAGSISLAFPLLFHCLFVLCLCSPLVLRCRFCRCHSRKSPVIFASSGCYPPDESADSLSFFLFFATTWCAKERRIKKSDQQPLNLFLRKQPLCCFWYSCSYLVSF